MRPLPDGMQISLKERKNFVRLDWNECPYLPSKKILKALHKSIKYVNQYPLIIHDNITEKISFWLDVPKECVGLFAGADGALGFAFLIASKKSKVVYTKPNYGYVEKFVKRARLTSKIIKSVYSPNIDKIYNALSKNNALVYISNPMAQTGLCYNFHDLYHFICSLPEVYFIIDETYAEYSNFSILDDGIPDNAVIVRSMSKSFSLAGARIGFAVAKPGTIEKMIDLRDLEGINLFAQVAAEEALKDINYMKSNVEKINNTKNKIIFEIEKLGYRVQNTFTNFFILKSEEAYKLQEFLKNEKIFVRVIPDWKNTIRINVGTSRDMKCLVSALKKWKGKN